DLIAAVVFAVGAAGGKMQAIRQLTVQLCGKLISVRAIIQPGRPPLVKRITAKQKRTKTDRKGKRRLIWLSVLIKRTARICAKAGAIIRQGRGIRRDNKQALPAKGRLC